MRLNKFSREQKKDLKKLLLFAKSENVQVLMRDARQLNGAGGLYCSMKKTIELPNNLTGGELALTLAHELGHYVSEKNKEVGWRQHKAYNDYPVEVGDICPPKSQQAIRYIETRATYHGSKLVEELELSIPKKEVDANLLYEVLSLKHIVEEGPLDGLIIDQLNDELKERLSKGESWKDHCSEFL